jgi:4'-phosphopantetheinyl transferase
MKAAPVIMPDELFRIFYIPLLMFFSSDRLLALDALPLPGDEVHVWHACLDTDLSDIDYLASILAADEMERARRFHFDEHRHHYIIARGLLRCLLGRYLEIEPDRLRFCYGEYGKPALVQEHGGDWMRFNLSHSHNFALYAFARNRELGIDIERIKKGFANEQIAERFFSEEETGVLRSLPKSLQDEAFFNCWTRKEAYIKAKGEGLSMPLHTFDVSLIPGEPARLLASRLDSEEASRWTLIHLTPCDGYVGAVAAEGIDWQLKLKDFDF